MSVDFTILLVAGMGIGIVIGWAFWGRLAKNIRETRSQLTEYAKQTEDLRLENVKLKAEKETEKKASEEKLEELIKARQELSNAFDALAKRALASNNEEFMRLAKSAFEKLQSDAKGDLEQRKLAVEGMISPIKESLEKQQKLLHEVEKTRQEHYGSITEQLKHLTEIEKSLSQETSNLVTALKSPNVRGSWGEQTLRRVVEIAGLNDYCDFTEQQSVNTEEGRLRPDLVVRMPGDRVIIVDAKNIFQAYYEAMELQDEVKRNALLDKHVRSVKEHIKKLSQKSYWEQFGESADFVVFFMPNENLYTEALKRDPSIFEEAVKQRILPAHPVSLAGFLQIIGHTWKQQKMSEYADNIKNLGQELYDRLADLAGNFSRVGSSLDTAVDAYNKSVGTLESRVLITAKRFKELGVSGKKDVKELPLSEKAIRQISKEELNQKK